MKSKIVVFIVSFWTIYLLIDKGECAKLKCVCSKTYCPENHVNFTCETDGNCFSQIKIDEYTDEIRKIYGCLPKEPSGRVSIFHCQRGVRKLEEENSVSCCYDRDFCNEDLKPTLRPTQERPSPAPAPKTSNVVIALVISVSLCFLVLITVIVWWCCRRANYEKYRQIKNKGRHIVSHQPTVHQLLNESGGSDFGLPKLMQRTIAREIQRTKRIGGPGQFSQVYEALWRNDKVAVRLYQSRDEFVWLQECGFYENMQRHDNILAFIASDRIGSPAETELFLITEYCPHGSLFEYLQSQHSLTKKDMLRCSSSIASGLTYLHTQVTGTYRRGAIAHRNLTSKGIYVKKGGVCAIGHFALALKSTSEFTEKDAEKSPKQPTKRYFAPELLDRSLVPGNCAHSGLLKADVYSLGLVLWEIAFTTESEGIQEPSQLPYQDMVSSNPSIEELHKVVCVDQKRPPILNRWYRDEVMKRTSRVIEECWHESPDARLTALRVQKTLTKVEELLTDENSIQVV